MPQFPEVANEEGIDFEIIIYEARNHL